MDETITRIDLMSIEEIKKFSNEISSKIHFDYDLKKAIGLISVDKLKLTLDQIICLT